MRPDFARQDCARTSSRRPSKLLNTNSGSEHTGSSTAGKRLRWIIDLQIEQSVGFFVQAHEPRHASHSFWHAKHCAARAHVRHATARRDKQRRLGKSSPQASSATAGKASNSGHACIQMSSALGVRHGSNRGETAVSSNWDLSAHSCGLITPFIDSSDCAHSIHRLTAAPHCVVCAIHPSQQPARLAASWPVDLFRCCL